MATIFNAGKAIGPSFPSELQAAGLMGLPCAWGSDGVFMFGEALTAAQITAIKSIITAHDALTPAPALTDAQLAALMASQKFLQALILYLMARLNELRTQPTVAFPALLPANIVAGVITVYKTLP